MSSKEFTDESDSASERRHGLLMKRKSLRQEMGDFSSVFASLTLRPTQKSVRELRRVNEGREQGLRSRACHAEIIDAIVHNILQLWESTIIGIEAWEGEWKMEVLLRSQSSPLGRRHKCWQTAVTREISRVALFEMEMEKVGSGCKTSSRGDSRKGEMVEDGRYPFQRRKSQ
jgi:hypothetical protein